MHVSNNYRAPYIYVECKNYTGDPANPELGQLAGRVSNRRGQVGILFCRKLKDKELFISTMPRHGRRRSGLHYSP
jgi:hypothetical protein